MQVELQSDLVRWNLQSFSAFRDLRAAPCVEDINVECNRLTATNAFANGGITCNEIAAFHRLFVCRNCAKCTTRQHFFYIEISGVFTVKPVNIVLQYNKNLCIVKWQDAQNSTRSEPYLLAVFEYSEFLNIEASDMIVNLALSWIALFEKIDYFRTVSVSGNANGELSQWIRTWNQASFKTGNFLSKHMWDTLCALCWNQLGTGCVTSWAHAINRYKHALACSSSGDRLSCNAPVACG